jgi:hypothetical protein
VTGRGYLCEAADPAGALRAATGETLGPLDAVLANTPPDTGRQTRPASAPAQPSSGRMARASKASRIGCMGVSSRPAPVRACRPDAA